MQKMKKWTEVYPQGTSEGNDEQKFFIALARNKKYDWRSVAAIARESNLTKKRVEEILKKYHNHPTCPVYNNPKNEDQWGYWDRVPDMVPKPSVSLSEKDQKKRISKVLNSDDANDDQKSYSKIVPMAAKDTSFAQLNTIQDITNMLKMASDRVEMAVKEDIAVLEKACDLSVIKVELGDVPPSQAETYMDVIKTEFAKRRISANFSQAEKPFDFTSWEC